jgi:hypothetical protein
MGLIDDENFKRILKRSLMEEDDIEDDDDDDEEEENDGNDNDDVETSEGGGFKKIAEKIFHSRNQIHIFHLQTKSYSEHIALNGFYDGIIGLFDGLVESYQGKHGIITNYQCDGFEDYSSGEQVIQYLEDLEDSIESLRKSVKESYIQNQIDTVEELINSTLYKLKFLK